MPNENAATVGRTSRDRLPKGLVRLSLDNAHATLAVWALFLVVASVGLSQVRIETSTDSILDRASESWSFYRGSVDSFGGDELVVVAVTSVEPFSLELLRRIREGSAALSEIDGVRRVDSLATVPLIRANEQGELLLDAALELSHPVTLLAREKLRLEVMRDRIAPRSLVSDDGRTAALNVFLDSDIERPFENVVEDIRRTIEGDGVLISGVPIFRTAINTRTAREVGLFAAGTVTLIWIILWLLFGAARLSTVPILVGVVGCWGTVGGMGLAGIPLSLSTMILPSIVLALGCAYATHYSAAMSKEGSQHEKRAAAEGVSLGVALSGLTTAIGFVVISSTPIEAIRQVGAMGAVGTIIVTIAAMSLSPVFLANASVATAPPFGARNIFPPIIRAAELAAARPRAPIVLSLVAALLGGWQLQYLELETDVTKWFREGNPIRDDYDEIGRRLSGISPINVVIDAPEGSAVSEPAVVKAIGALAEFLGELDDVGKVLSIADPLEQVHGVFASPGDSIDSRAMVEQYLLLLSSEEQIEDLISPDRARANIRVRVNDNGSDHLLEVAQLAEDWWEENGVPGYAARSTGIMFEFARSEEAIADGQLRGALFAVFAIAAILLAFFRSIRLAGAALVVNVVPIVAAFGGLAALGVPLDAGTVLVVNLALGIAVDDTVHLATALSSGERRSKALRDVVPALAATTLAVGVGFSLLGFSEFAFTRNLGLLTGIVMFLCFLSDVFVLPSLMRSKGRSAD